MASIQSRMNKFSKINGNCLEWVGAKSSHGYGRIYFAGKSRFAHRVAWQIINGEIPSGLFVCHVCDNRLCVKVEHLFLGTRQDNIQDMVNKKRRRGVGGQKGESHHKRKLTEAQVKNIRESFDPVIKLTKIYNVSRSTIYAIKTKHLWKHI